MNQILNANAWRYSDDVNTDVIMPGRYLDSYEPEYLASHAMEDLDPNFAKNVKEGDIVVGGKNFGCGSSREQAVTCLKYSGVSAIIAKSYARIFYRNSINNGLPVIVCPEAVDDIMMGNKVTIDFEASRIVNESTDNIFTFTPLPKFILEIIDDGGLIPHIQKKLDLIGFDE